MLTRSIFPVLLIFISLLILSTFIYGVYFIYKNKKEIDQNWPKYRCKPYVFPFAGWFIGPPNTNPMNNFRECSWLIFKSFFDVLISPFVKILTIIVSILTNFTKDIQNIRKMVNYMRDSIKNIATDIYNKLKDTYYRLAYVFKAFLKVFYNIFRTMKNSFNALLYSYYTLASVWNGPIGGTARFFCFDENTLIQMKDKTFKPIKDIKLNDKTKGGTVLALYELIANPQNMYVISDINNPNNEIIVSGSHLIFENNVWKRVEESQNAKPYQLVKGHPYPNKYIYSLRTSKCKIYTPLKDIIFRDYDELNDGKLNYILWQNEIDASNNNNKINEIKDYSSFYFPSKNKLYKPFFRKDTLLNLKNFRKKKIENIKIGDDLSIAGKVLGISKAYIDTNTPFYKLSLGYKELPDIICTRGCIIKNIINGHWQKIEENRFTEKIENHIPEIMYSILTENGTIIINHLTFQDHDNNYHIQDLKDKFIVQQLNNNQNII